MLVEKNEQNGRFTVCVLEPIHEAALELISKQATLILPEQDAVETWPEVADAIIVRNEVVSADQIAQAKKLQVIGKHGAGTDTIDVQKAAELNIPVKSTPGTNAASVADLALAMALSLSRNLSGHTAALREGHPLTGQARIGFEMAELPAGIIGLGAIGRQVASRLQAGFGVPVTGFDPGIDDQEWPADIKRATSLEALLGDSRLVFLHVGLNASTRHMIGSRELALLPANSFLINCSRGGVVDEAALADALQSGRIAGAASDVFEQEPPAPDHPLLQHTNFIATPHIGASTEEGLRRTGLEIANKVLAVLKGH